MPTLPPSRASHEPAAPGAVAGRLSDQRRREYKYRFAQTLIFGLPVLALQWLGGSLGGSPAEAQRWVALLQGILACWVTYIVGGGMIANAIATHGSLMDALVGIAGGLLTLFSLVSTLGIFFTGQPLYGPMTYHWAILLLGLYCGGRWWQLSRSLSH